ncbi:MAG TPA: phosphoribosyltransferase family protein [Candidatus Saccharimonadales bacterium]|nr:phosphoribosyltransferase family protein [Candidatus Saccharimonadales bacterium]
MLRERSNEFIEELRLKESILREKILKEAVVTNFEKGYVSIPSVNQLIDIGMQKIAAEMIIYDACRKEIHIDKVLGIPNSGISLATSVAERLNVPLAPGRKGETIPGSWNSAITIQEDVPSFTTGESSKFVFNGLHAGDSVLVVDDFIALGATSILVAKELQRNGINVEIAVYVAKLFQPGVKQIGRKLDKKPFYAIGIREIYSDGTIAFAPSNF